MDVHPSRELVASGQRAGSDRKSQAHVRIWSTESLQTLYVFGMGELNVGVTAVGFSQLVFLMFVIVSNYDFFSVVLIYFIHLSIVLFLPEKTNVKFHLIFFVSIEEWRQLYISS